MLNESEKFSDKLYIFLSVTALLISKCIWGGVFLLISNVIPAAAHANEILTIQNLPKTEMGSSYFDRAMGYENSLFIAVSLTEALDHRTSSNPANALILKCRDDYEGIIRFDEIRRYDVHFATKIRIDPKFKRPSWLKAGLVLIPDGASAPSMERFMTANIESINLSRSEEYYAPLDSIAKRYADALPGSRAYKQNCLFCHPVKGVGGNKGGSLPEKFNFKNGWNPLFESSFLSFHHKMNEDKQDMEQYVSLTDLKAIGVFLKRAAADSR